MLLPEQSSSWLGPWIEEHVSFPMGRHDDQVDCASMALARLRRYSGTSEAPVGGEPILGAEGPLGELGDTKVRMQF